jgi:TPR repeat protein
VSDRAGLFEVVSHQTNCRPKMRRQDIQLLALARQGDPAARREAGRRYLAGGEGFPRHVPTGIEYLSRPSVAGHPDTARIISEALTLEEIVSWRQEQPLAAAAAAGVTVAQVKHGTWLCVRYDRLAEGAQWMAAASRAGNEAARRAVATLHQPLDASSLPAFLRALGSTGELDLLQITLIALRQALTQRNLDRLASGLRIAYALVSIANAELSEMTAAAVSLAEQEGQQLIGIEAKVIEASLDARAAFGDRDAAYSLGRALCGIACGELAPLSLVSGFNVRKGAALLLRAADGGCELAWLHLYRVHSDNRCSVANPQMARFCLEKAASTGQTEAQRRLGALELRSASSLRESERAIQWLQQAAQAQDVHAQTLLKSLVLPLHGDDNEAHSAIGLVRRDDPLLAVRLELARYFGLTKAEALSVDPAEGMRPWGLVVGPNPFISQIRLSAARAIPALSTAAMEALRRGASLFNDLSRDALAYEGDLRRRSARQRRAFERHGLDEASFFVNASSTTLDTLRIGTKWACKVKTSLQLALAA